MRSADTRVGQVAVDFGENNCHRPHPRIAFIRYAHKQSGPSKGGT